MHSAQSNPRLLWRVGRASALRCLFGFLLACSWSISCPAKGDLEQNTLARRPNAVDETYPDVDVIYDSVLDTRQQRLRLIITRPTGATRPIQTLFLIGWLSCVTTEAPPYSKSALATLFHNLARTPDLVFVRVDKPGVGDSQGECENTDFDVELSGYRAAIDHLASFPFVDSTRTFILGLSNGGGVAPLVPKLPVAGYIVEGAWAKTWYEHMLEIERRRLTLIGKTPGEINKLMSSEAELYTEYLIKGRNPQQLVGLHPDWKNLWDDTDYRHQYGRPTTFYQQLQKLNVASAWSAVGVPVLVLHGDFDWVMSREDHHMIVEMINKNSPGKAQLVDLPNTGHSLDTYHSMKEAFADMGGPLDPATSDRIIAWLKERR